MILYLYIFFKKGIFLSWSSSYVVMREEISNWIRQVKEDLEKAQILFDNKKFDGTAFYCHQAVEKGLKGLLIKKTKEFPKIHDLVRLGRLVDIDSDLLKDCEKLTFVYTETRYPDVSNVKYTKEESEKDIKIAEKVIRWIDEKL